MLLKTKPVLSEYQILFTVVYDIIININIHRKGVSDQDFKLTQIDDEFITTILL